MPDDLFIILKLITGVELQYLSGRKYKFDPQKEYVEL